MLSLLLYVRAWYAVQKIRWAVWCGWDCVVIDPEVADVILREAIEIGPEARPWVEAILDGGGQSLIRTTTRHQPEAPSV